MTEQEIAAMEARAQHDFDTGRTVVVDGWVIAECEARMCLALAGRG